MSFWAGLKRRKVFQVAAVYAVVAWLIIQMNLPEQLDTVLIVQNFVEELKRLLPLQ